MFINKFYQCRILIIIRILSHTIYVLYLFHQSEFWLIIATDCCHKAAAANLSVSIICLAGDAERDVTVEEIGVVFTDEIGDGVDDITGDGMCIGGGAGNIICDGIGVGVGVTGII